MHLIRNKVTGMRLRESGWEEKSGGNICYRSGNKLLGKGGKNDVRNHFTCECIRRQCGRVRQRLVFGDIRRIACCHDRESGPFDRLLEVLLRRTCGVRHVAAPLKQRHAGFGVPAVVAPHPRHFRRKRGHQVVDGPRDDRIIIHCHVQVREADRVPDPWSRREALLRQSCRTISCKGFKNGRTKSISLNEC